MCARPLGAAVRRVRWPTNEYEYDGVWNEACVRELSVFPTTTGAPPHEFHTYLNQQDEVLVEVTATLSTQLVRLGLHRVCRGFRLRFALDQRLDLVLDFCGDLGFPEPVQRRDAVLEPRRDLPGDGIRAAAVRGGHGREGLECLC